MVTAISKDKGKTCTIVDDDSFSIMAKEDYGLNPNQTITKDYIDEVGLAYEITMTSSRRPVKSSQKGMENVAEETQYDDYHINTKGQGILSVENVIEEIEGRGNQAVLTVQTSDGSTNHSQFGSKDWKEYKDSVNDAGNAITDVWVTEVEPTYIRNSRQIKSDWERTDMITGPIWDKDNWRIIEKSDYDLGTNTWGEEYYMLRDKSNLRAKDIRFNTLAEAMDYVDFRANLNSSRRSIKSSKETFEMESYITGRDHETDFLRFSCDVTKNGDKFEWNNVRSYFDDEDFENPELQSSVYGVYDNQEQFLEDVEEFLNSEQGQDVMRKEYEKAKENGDVRGEDGFQISNSHKSVESTNYNNLEKELVTKILSGKLNEEKAARVIAMSKKCNLGYAKQILSTWIEERSPSLIKNGVRHVVLNNAFDPDGNIDSWSMDFVPQSGMADTKAGEILRAFNQIQCSWFNHGYKVGDYKGSEYVNSAARFLKSHTDEKISKLLESATRCHDIESYDNMIQSMRTSLENYLCNNSHLFQSVNEEDMWDEFSPEDNDSGELDDVKLVNGNSFIEFKNEDGSWVCTKINVDTEYNEGDTFTLEDDIAENFEAGDGEYGDFVSEGIRYSWESLNDNEYRINAVSFEDDYFVEDSDYTSDEIISYCADNPDWVLCNKDNDEVDMDYFN